MCLDESTLIRLVAGELGDEQRRACVEHVQVCHVCRQKHAELAATWDLLGQWPAEAPRRDLSGAIVAQACRRQSPRRWASVAAAVLIAGGAGVAAGILAPAPPAAVAHQNVSTEQLVQAIGLDALGDQSLALAGLFPSSVPTTLGSEEGQP